MLEKIYGLGVQSFLAGTSSLVLFGAALPNFGVRRLLDAVTELARPPAARNDAKGEPRGLDTPFSGLVFKVRPTWTGGPGPDGFRAVCSGRFQRGMVLAHGAWPPVRHKYAESCSARTGNRRGGLPGDVIGLVDAMALRPGDTLYAGEPPVASRPSRASRPSTSRWCAARKRARTSSSGAGSSSWTPRAWSRCCPPTCAVTRPPCWPPLGLLQFDVVLHRLEHEFGARAELDRLDYTLARRTDADGARHAGRAACRRGAHPPPGRRHARAVRDKWRLGQIEREYPDLLLESAARRGPIRLVPCISADGRWAERAVCPLAHPAAVDRGRGRR